MTTFRLFSALTLALASTAHAEVPDIITPDTMRAHIAFLADDAMRGRDTGSAEYEIAARYVATRLASAGLKPAGTAGWFQPVPFKTLLIDDAQSAATIGGTRFANRKDVLIGAARTGGSETIELPVVFAGFCIDDPKTGRNDFAGLNVKGKAVACLQGFPKGMASDIGAHYGRSKGQMVARQGGVALVTIRTLERERTRSWARELEGPVHPSLAWAQPDGSAFTETPTIRFGVTLHDAPAKALFAGAPVALDRSLPKLTSPADGPGDLPSKCRSASTGRRGPTT